MPQQPATSFDDDLKAVRADFEKDLAAARDAAQNRRPLEPSLAARLLDWLPTVGGAIGGMVGGIPGAAIGGAAGQGLKTTAEHVAELPGAVADVAGNLVAHPRETMGGFVEGALGGANDTAVEGAMQGGMTAVGSAAAPVVKWGGRQLMQSAVKPAFAMVEKQVAKNEVPRVVQTLLDEGINVTQRGIGKINSLLKATNDEINDIIVNSGRKISPTEVVRTARGAVRAAGNQVAPSADKAAARNVIEDFIASHARDATGDLKRMPVQRAQELKVGTYKAIGSRAYGETKGAALEAEKGLARGLKEGIERQHPEVKKLNAREGSLIEAKDAIVKRIALAANRDPGGIGWVAENPRSFMAFLLARSPAVKSMLARGLYQSASKAARVPEHLIRLAVQSLATSDEESE